MAAKKPSFEDTNCSSTSAGVSSRIAATINGGVVAGSKCARIRVGVPAKPARIELCQNALTPTTWATTSWTVQLSQRLADRQSSALRSASIPCSRLR